MSKSNTTNFCPRHISSLSAIAAVAAIIFVVLAGCGRWHAQEEADAPVIDYANLDLNRLEEMQKPESAYGRALTNENGAVHRAWAGVMTNLLAARTELDRQGKALEEILDISKITNGTQSQLQAQFLNRRMMCNKYRDAVDKWRYSVKNIGNSYVNELSKWQVSPPRAIVESEELRRVLGDQIRSYTINSSIQTELKVCDVETQLAMQSKYAVGSMEIFYFRREATFHNNQPTTTAGVPIRPLPWETQSQPTPAATAALVQAREKYEKHVAAMEKLRQTTRDLRASVAPAPATVANQQ